MISAISAALRAHQPADLRKTIHAGRRRRIGDQPLAQSRRIFRDMPQRDLARCRRCTPPTASIRSAAQQAVLPMPAAARAADISAQKHVARMSRAASMLFMSLLSDVCCTAPFIPLPCAATVPTLRCNCFVCRGFSDTAHRFAHIRHCFPSIVRKTGVPAALRIWVASCMTCRQSPAN